MAKDRHRDAAERQTLAERARLAWVKARVANIHQHVSAYDVLRRGGVELKQAGEDRDEQFSCPFHGLDRSPSARVYPTSARSPSHAWCFVCQERWDAISLWQRFNPSDKAFSGSLGEIEKAFGLRVPELSEDAFLAPDQGDADLEEFDRLHEVCDNQLRRARPAYKYFDDMVGFLSAGSVLDKLRHRVDNRLITPARGVEVLRQLQGRITDKERRCPEG